MKKFTLEGRPIREARNPIMIFTSDADVKKAKRKDPACCVVAQAFKRAPKVEAVRVFRSRTYIQFQDKPYWVRYKTPVRAAIETVAWDRGGGWQHSNLSFLPLQPSQRAAARKALTAAGKTKKYKSEYNGTRPRRQIHQMRDVRGAAHLSIAA